jgi:hypothetical protein
MPKDTIATTPVGTINLIGKDFADYVDKVAKEYGIKVMSQGKSSATETEVCFHGRKNDLERFLRKVYGCAEGEEENFIDTEFDADIIFFNLTVLGNYLKDTGWKYTSHDYAEKGKNYSNRFYDNTASDGSTVRVYLAKVTDDSPIHFSVINYENPQDGILDGRAFEEGQVSEGIDYAESYLQEPEILSPAEAWLKRGGDKINLRPDIDF